jgi:hypothetical protein
MKRVSAASLPKSRPASRSFCPAAGSAKSSGGSSQGGVANRSGIGCASSQRPTGEQREPAEAPVVQARHLGRDHAAHRVADEVRLFQAERLDHVPAVQREVEHVLQQLFARLLAEARPDRREDVEALGQLREQRLLRQQAARAVQEHERSAGALLAHAALDPAPGLDRALAHRGTSGRTRFSYGSIHQRRSSFHSGQRPCRLGITRSAKSRVE